MLMNLMMAGGTTDPTYFPNSGPGSKYLLTGNTEAGFFGEVSAADLIDGVDLLPLITSNTLVTQKVKDMVWLKYYFGNKVVFIAKQNLVGEVSWAQLYESGLIYGTPDDGKYPTAKPTSQMTVIEKQSDGKTWRLKLRTIKSATTDPYLNAGTAYPDSEWTKTILNSLSTSGVNKLASYTLADISAGGKYHTHAAESDSTTTTSAMYLAGGGTIQTRVTNPKASTAGTPQWRPVLELITSGDTLLPLVKAKASIDDLVPPSISSVQYNATGQIVNLTKFKSDSPVTPAGSATIISDDFVTRLTKFKTNSPLAPVVTFQAIPD